jgi:Arc/MetJ-type ribon-helix-helix transcriptional regulator
LLNFRSPPELTAKIDDWRAEQPEPQPSRSEAIRRLLEKALARFKRRGTP